MEKILSIVRFPFGFIDDWLEMQMKKKKFVFSIQALKCFHLSVSIPHSEFHIRRFPRLTSIAIFSLFV